MPQRILASLPALRCRQLGPATAATAARRAAELAASDVVLSSDPLSTELALLCGTPVVALGRDPASLPQRAGVQGLSGRAGLASVELGEVLQALGLA